MNIPEELRYTEEHEWVKLDGNVATVGITDFAQSELGDIVYLEIDTLDAEINSNDVFGTVEAVKTVSDLFMPVNGRVIDINSSSLKTLPVMFFIPVKYVFLSLDF